MRIKLVKLIQQAVLDNTPERVLLRKLRGVIQDAPDFNIREKRALYRAALRLADLMYTQNNELYSKQIMRYYVDTNKVLEHKNDRDRKLNLVKEMRTHRASTGVFYMSSMHSNPAPDHADWQGVVFVDRYWRSVLGDDEDTKKKVAAYIRNHDIVTVQDICGAPVYMITRPHCKHYMIPLDTDEVLNNGVNRIRTNHEKEVRVRTHNLNYRKKFYKFRDKVATVLKNKQNKKQG